MTTVGALAADDASSEIDIRICIDVVMACTAQCVAEAASDAPWAIRLGRLRDLLSFCVLNAFVVYAWGILS